jgi:hypothetical protein
MALQDVEQVQRWLENSDKKAVLLEVCDVVRDFNKCKFFKARRNLLFAIGQFLKGRVCFKSRTILGLTNVFYGCVGPVCQAIFFHDAVCAVARAGVSCWLLIAGRLGIAKKARLRVAEMIWSDRREARHRVTAASRMVSKGWTTVRSLIVGGRETKEHAFFFLNGTQR